MNKTQRIKQLLGLGLFKETEIAFVAGCSIRDVQRIKSKIKCGPYQRKRKMTSDRGWQEYLNDALAEGSTQH